MREHYSENNGINKAREKIFVSQKVSVMGEKIRNVCLTN